MSSFKERTTMTNGTATPPSLTLTPAEAQALRPQPEIDARNLNLCGNWKVYTPEELRGRLEKRGSWAIPNFNQNSRP